MCNNAQCALRDAPWSFEPGRCVCELTRQTRVLYLFLALSPGVDRDQRGLQAYVRHNLSRSHDRDALCEAESYLYVSRGSGL